MAWRDWLLDRVLAREVDARVQAALKAVDDPYWRNVTDGQPQARPWHEVRATLERVAELARTNPLAARLVAMTTDFVIGAGARLEGPPWAQAFWDDPRTASRGGCTAGATS